MNVDRVHVALLGSRSFIGTHLEHHLEMAGHLVHSANSDNCDLLIAGQTDSYFRELPKGSVVIFAAAVNKFVDNSYSSMVRNLQMAQNLVTAPQNAKLGGLIFLSSVDVYGLQPKCPITEQTITTPSSYYGLSKLANETILAMPGALNCSLAILRLPGVYGLGDNSRSVIGKFTNIIRAGGTITLNGDGNVLRDFVAINDLCALIEKIVTKPFSGLINVASGKSFSIRAIIEIISNELKLPTHVKNRPPDRNAAGNLVFDIKKLQEIVPESRIKPLDERISVYLSGKRNQDL